MAANFTEEFVDIGGSKIHMKKGGSGDPLLFLHGAGGHFGWPRYLQELSDRYTVYIPSHPGYGQSERPDWLETIPDLACFYSWFMEQQGLHGVRAIGHSMGGWLAAEIAVSCRHAFSKLLLIDPAGIKPNEGEILDVFIISPQQVLDNLFHDPKQAPEYEEYFGQEPTPEMIETAERNREMAVRLTWKPYMHDPRLSHLLAGIKVPTRIIWGRDDKLVPVECGQLYRNAIPNSDLVIVDDCGHIPQLEKPDEFIKQALDFLA